MPRSDYDAVLARATNAEKKVKDQEAASHQAEIDAAIKGAMKAGKITPASEKHYRALCAREGGLADFKGLVDSLPTLLADQVITNHEPPQSGGASTLTDSQRAICRAMGLSEEAYLQSLTAAA